MYVVISIFMASVFGQKTFGKDRVWANISEFIFQRICIIKLLYCSTILQCLVNSTPCEVCGNVKTKICLKT